MATWNPKGVRVGMVLDTNLRVANVVERNGFRYIHLAASNLPAGFAAQDIVLTVPASQQEVTLEESNMEIPD